MKSLMTILLAMFTTFSVNGQKSVDEIFKIYSEKSDYTTIIINRGMANVISLFEKDGIMDSVTEIRIITQEDEDMPNKTFFNDIKNALDLGSYEELVRIKESDQEVSVLIKQEKDYIRELLVLVGGEDNAFIQIKGKMGIEEAERLLADIDADVTISIN